MTERERGALMPEHVRQLAEDIFARSVRYQTGQASREFLESAAADAIRAAKAFDREWQVQKEENDRLPTEDEAVA